MRPSAASHAFLRRCAVWLAALCLPSLAAPCAHAQERNAAGREFPQIQLPSPARGRQALQMLGRRLPQVAAWYGKSEAELRGLLLREPNLWVDPQARLLYLCEFEPPSLHQRPHGLHGSSPAASMGREGWRIQGAYPPEQTFLLHSRPGASKVIYLDFNGHVTSGTPWNSSFNGGQPITSAPFNLDSSPSTFNTTELDRIQYIWQRVAEDFAPLDVDVTTQDPGVEALRRTSSTDAYYGVRLIITPSNFYANAGGVAYIGSFAWSSDTPAFVFSNMLANGEKHIAEAISHEVGHTLGLYHDGKTGGTAYYQGHGSWAPIMGVGYYKEVTQWSRGEYSGANNTQDDLAVMLTYGLTYRPDDHGNTFATARLLSGARFSTSGIIEQRSDVDVFTFRAGAGPLTITVSPGLRGPNLDILARLYSANGVLLASSNPTTLGASLSLNVPAGTYYLSIDGVGSGSPSTTGYSDYASLGHYTVSGTVAAP